MGRNRASAMFIGVLVCIPLLALYRWGWFTDSAYWISNSILPRLLILPQQCLRTMLPLQYAYYTVAAFVSAWVCIELFCQWRKFAFLLGVAFLTCSFTVILAWQGILFEPFSGILAALSAGAIGIALSGGDRGYRRHMLRRFFVGRLSLSRFEQLANLDEPEKLTDRREITVLTCRMSNHVELSEESQAKAFEEFTAFFEQQVSEFLVSRGGYLDTCTAQRVRVLFGYPLPDDNHALHAAQILLQLRAYWTELKKEMHTRWGWKPRFGASLSTGTVSCGLFGHREFQNFSAVGEAVDFGDRLCSLNTIYGSKMLISAHTYSLIKDAIEARPMEMVAAPRARQAVEVYELLGARGDLDEAEIRARDAFSQGLAHLRKGERKLAQVCFERARMDGRDDAPLRYFAERAAGPRQDPVDDSTADSLPRHARSLSAV